MVVEGWVVLNFFCGLLLVLLLVFQRSTSRITTGKRYSAILIMTLVLLASETVGRIGEAHPDNLLFLAQIGYFMIFLLDPVDILFALTYIDCWMDKEKRFGRNVFSYCFQAFAFVNIAMVTISEVLDLKLFYYFEDGLYYRGPYFMVRAVLMMIFIMLLTVYVLIFRKNIYKEYRNAILMLPILSFVGAVLQIFLANMDMTYAGISVGCLILFFSLQSRDINVDYLTGVLNRRGLDIRLEEKVKQSISNGNRFSAIMMDVDHFKEINDHYGHRAGDDTIRDVACILVDIFGVRSHIGRFGGDEFCIVTGMTEKEELEAKIDLVHKAIKRDIKEKNGWPEMIDVSCGYSIYDPDRALSAQEFQENIDKLMYEEKQRHHLNDRRKTERNDNEGTD
ncbi:GGDEF domain-containing protein [Butyrivibrio sp. WCD3002]|uniref:GGDEF domain-containing protein n=1 Tax=Butyrivibrio sp. WCD3002 TaxID=1280676 RepID=UPI00040F7538|nr:GGDEF domain-containing protein [Butyrivibrio sp. WCD3002]